MQLERGLPFGGTHVSERREWIPEDTLILCIFPACNGVSNFFAHNISIGNSKIYFITREDTGATINTDKDEICKFPDKPFEMKAFPCHTQSVERMVKEVSAASCHVFGAKKRDGFVRGRCFGRKVVPKADTKSDFLGMLKN